MRRELLHLMLSWPLAAVLVGWAPAQDGPLLPGFESSPPIEDATAPMPGPETPEVPVFVPPGDDIRPLDANGIPQTGPPAEGELALPEPPAIEPQAEESPKRNWLQKSTDAIRGLAKPDSRAPDPTVPQPKTDNRKSSDAVRNWQMLRRQPTSSGQTVPGQRVQTQGTPQQRMPSQEYVPQRTMQPRPAMPPQGATNSKRNIQTRPSMKKQGAVPSQSQMRPPAGVEARNRAYQQPSSRRQVQQAPGQTLPRMKSQTNPRESVDSHRTADNDPRSPWEHPAAGRLRPGAPAIKAAPSQGTDTKSMRLRSATGFTAPSR